MSDLRTIDLALSGGGTRAALLSGGALIAVCEAEEAGAVNVGSITAVSGSALLLARVILRGSRFDAQEKPPPKRSSLIRTEVSDIWRHGFRPRGVLLASGVLAIGLTLVLFSYLVPRLLMNNDPLTEYPWCFVIPLAAMAAIGIPIAVHRSIPFNLGQTKGRIESFLGYRRQHKFISSSAGDEVRAALPTEDVKFGVVNAYNGKASSICPWDAHTSEGYPNGIPLGVLVKASAAVPFYTSSVVIDDQRFFDGGVVDNLGLSDHIDSQRRNQLLVVDASVPLKVPPTQPQQYFARLRNVVCYLVRWVVGAWARRLCAQRNLARILLGRTCFSHLWADRPFGVLRMLVGFLWDQLSTEISDLSTEFRSLAIAQSHMRSSLRSKLEGDGRLHQFVELPRRIPEHTDFKTKLGRLQPAQEDCSSSTATSKPAGASNATPIPTPSKPWPNLVNQGGGGWQERG